MLRADEPKPRDPCPSLPGHVVDLVAAAGARLRRLTEETGGAKAGTPPCLAALPRVAAPPGATETPSPVRRRRGGGRIVVASGWGERGGVLSARRPLR